MSPQHVILFLLNVGLIAGGIYLFTRKNLLSYLSGGQWWLTWLAVGVITLMDELTSVFYAPSEAYRYLSIGAIFFIPLTALVIHYMTTRMVEIAEILDFHGLKGGGVYNFSYLVLGPVVSFVAVASIMVDYILTAALSTVSAVENATTFFNLGETTKTIIEFSVIWLIAFLNILGIRENAKVTFGIFVVTGTVLLNVIFLGFFQMGPEQMAVIGNSFTQTTAHFADKNFIDGYFFLIAGLSSCILAYSGVESVLQTASLVKNWRTVSKAYMFLAVSVGVLIPLLSVLALSSTGFDIRSHEGDLITFFSAYLGGKTFGILVGAVASITLLMAMNTAYVASSELIERVAHRYNFNWLLATNGRASLYRIHILNALQYSLIIYITRGKQMTLAEMYAVGLIASFVINLGTLLIYRYFKGTKEVYEFNVSRMGTLIFFILILSCFIYVCYHKPAGFIMWSAATVFSLILGIYGTRKRAPEIVQIQRGENPMDIVFYIAENANKNVHIYFKRPSDNPQEKAYDVSLYVTFYSPRQTIPQRMGPNHFRIPFKKASIFQNMVAILDLMVYELQDRNITVHFGWPTSSWYDRFSTGVMVFQFMRMPNSFPQLNFRIEKFKHNQ